jgi:hypothetical protein
MLADPHTLELAVRTQALVLVAKERGSGQQLLELLVEIERRTAEDPALLRSPASSAATSDARLRSRR